MPGAFGHKFYWRSGVFGVMLGFAELSLVKNLNRVDYTKHQIAEFSEKNIEKVKDNEQIKKAKEKLTTLVKENEHSQ